VRVYLPATLATLADFAARGQVPADCERFVAADETEEAEYDALAEAAQSAAALLDGAGRRVVVVAEVSDADAAVPMSEVAAVHVDTEDIDPTDEELPDLGWFATQEIPDLLRAGG
jgi:hypothetical protein